MSFLSKNCIDKKKIDVAKCAHNPEMFLVNAYSRKILIFCSCRSADSIVKPRIDLKPRGH